MSQASKTAERHLRKRASARSSNKVVPLEDVAIEVVEEKGGVSDDVFQKEGEGYDVFPLIFTAAIVVGLPLTPSMLSTEEDIAGPAKIWSFFMTGFRVFMMSLYCRYFYHIFASPAVRWCTLINAAGGFIVMFYLIFKRRQVVSSINEIRSLTSSYNVRLVGNTFRRYFKVCFFGSFFFINLFISIASYFFFSVEYSSFVQNIKPVVPFSTTSPYYESFNLLVIFALVFCYQMSINTLFTSLFMCCAVYNSGSQLLRFYQKKMAEDVAEGPVTDESVSENMGLFRTIISVIKEAEELVSFCAFFIYIAVINSSFDAEGLVLTLDQRLFSPIIDGLNGMIITYTAMLFFYLTFNSNTLNAQCKILQKSLLELTDSVLLRARSKVIVYKFDLLTWNIRAIQLYGTGFDFFDIDNKMILPFFGVLLTYGVLINDLGANGANF